MIDADVIVTIPRGSTEPAVAELTSPTGETIDATTVEISVDTDSNTYVWAAAAWVGAAGTTRSAETTASRTWTTGDYVVHVRLDGQQIIRCTNRIQVP